MRERIGQKIAALEKVRDNIGQVIVGQKDIVEQMLAGLLAGGHCLLEGVPGLGKTLLVKSLAQSLSLDFRRVQFTPDLMPSDLIGTEILEEDHGTGHRFFKFQRGPVFTHILLADEINRTPPKTQAALLEVMQERSVSYAGETHQLQPPFFVLATQNPIELAGTYALPEAQLDRFLMHLRIDYPSEAEEQSILRRTTGTRSAELKAVMDRESMLELQTLTREISVSDAIIDYVARL
ncbi:MAG: AAA family ATPase, partial [Gammaproteobacteria bacterium]